MPQSKNCWTALLIGGLLVVGCTDDAVGPSDVPFSRSLDSAPSSSIPLRSSQRSGTYNDFTDSELWSAIEAGDSLAMVGFKAVGSARGVWRGQITIGRSEWLNARAAVSGLRGVTIVYQDSLLPRVKVRLLNENALRILRRLPFIDYVEPAIVPTGLPLALGGPSVKGSNQVSLLSDGSGGCGLTDWNSSYQYYDNDIIPDAFVLMEFPKAWTRSAGHGVTVGLTDTGIFSFRPETRDFRVPLATA